MSVSYRGGGAALAEQRLENLAVLCRSKKLGEEAKALEQLATRIRAIKR